MARVGEPIPVYLDANRHGVVRCRACGGTRPIHMTTSPAPLGGKRFKVTCRTCHRVFAIRVECRRHQRITTQLPGKLVHRGAHDLFELITVTSLSASGIGFVLSQPRPFQVGACYEVGFELPDPERSLVLEDIVLTRLGGREAGAAFVPPDRYNHHLDFYLVPDFVDLGCDEVSRVPGKWDFPGVWCSREA
jgi:hypothetical protein